MRLFDETGLGRKALWASAISLALFEARLPANEPTPDNPEGRACSVANRTLEDPTQECSSKWGIEVTALRVSAQGNLIDFRYRVLDAEKASLLGDPKNKAKLIDQETGKELHVPSMPKVGQLRSKSNRPTNGKVYTALFANPGAVVKPGQKVTVVIGDFRAENLTVSN
jgi:hypothetical protein